MRIVPISESECTELLRRVTIGRLGSALDNQPYIVPIAFHYDADRNCLYLFSTVGKKIKWMRQNSKICLQADEISNRSNWTSVVVSGRYVELQEPQFTAEKQHALDELSEFASWYRNAVAVRREQMNDLQIEPVFFRVDIQEISGLRSFQEG